MSIGRVSSRTRYRVLWYIPASRSLHPASLPGDYVISGVEGLRGPEIKARVLARGWPAGTIFEVESLAGTKPRLARCYLEQIKAWRPLKEAMPMGLPIDQPISRSGQVAKYKDLLSEAFIFALENDLIDTDARRRLTRALYAALDGHLAQWPPPSEHRF